ncbi:capsid cement protein [Agrobacterium sp. rho-13.3]|uniref:capsid cement protein n=1 Tax=Agrobacterium sp. rho-13.3 TaxID=3072980 RepID=UPI002A0B59B2|nr:capsid cement protein [Agrobacterium sp. rho-13.3]MDX8310029.1 DUF2190 family protein [Agrobacterium sp. rho-13.3]
MNFFIDILSLTATATTLFDEGDLVDFNDAKIVTDDQPVKGVAKHPATEVGMSVALVAIGVGRSRASGAITKGAKLISAAGGGVKAAGATPANAFATALTAAANGEFVSYLVR